MKTEGAKMSKITVRPPFLWLHPNDNVGVALADLPQGSLIVLDHGKIRLHLGQNIKFGHKFAICPIIKGQKVMKYGIPIGMATADIGPGEHVHLHINHGNVITISILPSALRYPFMSVSFHLQASQVQNMR